METDEPLPPELYTGPEAFLRERRSVFGNAWLLLARADAIRTPGDYIAESLGGWPVLAIADARGAPCAFRNVCRHQRLPLFDSGRGHCEQIRCRYHGWTYDIAGRFISAPPPVAPSGELSPDLERISAQPLHGLLFVHLDDDPPALAVSVPALAEARLETRGFHAEITNDIAANWKLVMEQALADARDDVVRVVEWPCVIFDLIDGGAVLHQVVARSFHRTRIHHHHYGAPAALEWSAACVARWRAGALARQAALEAGVAAALPASVELEVFRNRLRPLYADSSIS
ncbi:MAG TPA: Rieske 2Fe-2S domain-containing protein [Stellaceae bacterium]|nr:Rieske 2Fe-2S domain-containing protein [Stellaceae bacterium]